MFPIAGKSGQKASKESIASSASGKKRGIGSHHYLYNTPADFKVMAVFFCYFRHSVLCWTSIGYFIDNRVGL